MAQHDERMEGQQEETRLASEVGSKTDTSDTGGPTGQEEIALFEASEQEALRDRWSAIQTSFVDEPRRSVEEANDLVADLMNRLVSSFRDEQSRLEEQWSRGEEVTTEDLRMTLQRYRSFFGRVLKL